MPYENQFGSKTAHSDIVKNPDVQEFLKKCRPIHPPSDEGQNAILDGFVSPPEFDQTPLVIHVIASDGSLYVSSIDDRLPSIKAAYLKFSTILIEMEEFSGLQDQQTNMIDPFKVAALRRNRDALSAVLPLSNLKIDEDSGVRETFRRQTEDFLASTATRFRADNPDTSLLSTLTELALLRPDDGQHKGMIRIHKCPYKDCEQGAIYIDPRQDNHVCPSCKKGLYISDCLRIWEAINDFFPNQEPASRFMSYIEHLLPIHYLRNLRDHSPQVLANVAVLIDGPLAVFGNAAWLHRSIMQFLFNLKKQPVVMGLQKGGYVSEYMSMLQKRIPPNKLFSISDEFRYNYLGIEPSDNGFGSETYYGHDFAFKTPRGKLFIFALPYPFQTKSVPNFVLEKVKVENYPTLRKALRLITEVETDLYKNAVAPIALAHKYTAISLRPGGRVLDILGRSSIR
ncbi:MAG: hypothetical protein AB1650_01640 [Candidatus Omnitrophota bacterium]